MRDRGCTVIDLAAIPFLQARDFHRGPRTVVNWIVIHTAEVAPLPTSANALMLACHRGSTGPDGKPRLASWHFAVDSENITQSVKEEDIAFHAPGANKTGIGIELACRCMQNDWRSPYSQAMLGQAAQLVAALCAKWDVPVAFVDAAALAVAARGITVHAECTKAFGGTHQDPGPNFDRAGFVALVVAAQAG